MNANELQTVEASFLESKNAECQLKQPKDFITCNFNEADKMMSKWRSADKSALQDELLNIIE
jgi:hypothetical protein